MSKIRWLLALTLADAALIAPVFSDLWYEHYQKGEDALKEQRWADAIQQFTQALEKKPQPESNARTYGMNFVQYHPYLKLGIAYFNMGRLDAALQALDTEERLGAIGKETADFKNLSTYRDLVAQRKGTDAAAERERLAAVVADSIRQAEALEQQGKLDEAVAALGKGLAVEAGNARAVALMERLRDRLQVIQEKRQNDERFAELLEAGRKSLEANELESASSLFNQALSLQPDSAEARDLLEGARARLRAEIQAKRGAEERQHLVDSGLAEVASLEKQGRLSEALRKLEEVLAAEPGHATAVQFLSRLVQAQAASQLKESRVKDIARLLDEGGGLMREGQYERALAAFNRVVALDPANSSARALLGRAFSAMNEAILSGAGPVGGPTLPPVIAVGNRNNAADDEERPEERVSSADFVVTGIIISSQPRVQVSFFHSGRSGGTESEPAPREVMLDGEKMGTFYRHPFEHALTLSPGRARVRISVTDAGGLSAESIHQVRYVRPLMRSPWPYLGMGALGAGVAGVYQGVRIRRRNRLLKRRFNPYVAGAPVLQEDLFVGREVLLARILQTIHNNSILLYGERRIGKTSLQHHLRRRLQLLKDDAYDFYPVYIDLQGTPQERFFLTMAQDIFTELAPVLEPAGVRLGDVNGAAYDYPTFVGDVREVLKALKRKSSKKVKLILLIDEVDELNKYDPRINQKLRSLFMKSFAEDMVAVVSGVGIKKEWASEGSPWYNFFEEIEVRPFARQDAVELIEKPVRGIFKLDRPAVNRIIETTGCKPYLIQKLCTVLVSRMHDEGRRRITIADVDSASAAIQG